MLPVYLFSVIYDWHSGCNISPRRSGAQRGALENKLRPEVFLGAPLLYPRVSAKYLGTPTRVHPRAYLNLFVSLHQAYLFAHVNSRVSQQGSDGRFFKP
jgi:hypothetical protein